MTPIASDIGLLVLGAVCVLVPLTILGEVIATRRPGPVIETYRTRVNSWWAMVVLFALALLLGRTGVLLLFAFAAFAALREFLTFTAKSQADHLALAMAFFVVLPLQFVFIGLGWTALFSVFIPVYAVLLLPMVSVLRGDTDRFLIRVAETQWGLMICVYCASHVPALMTLDIEGYEDRSVLLIAFLILVVQLGDLLDFYFGRKFGRHKIAPKLSPKTWEGMILGVASAALIGAAFAWLTPFGIIGAALMAALASMTGMMGSLVLTAIKRDKGVRDWSHLIPGQGGFLDQLDSALFAAPIFYHMAHLFWAV